MEELYTPVEAAELLKVTRAAIYKWMKEGRIAFVYVGSDRRITKGAIEAFIKESTEARRKVDGMDTIEGDILSPGHVAALTHSAAGA